MKLFWMINCNTIIDNANILYKNFYDCFVY